LDGEEGGDNELQGEKGDKGELLLEEPHREKKRKKYAYLNEIGKKKGKSPTRTRRGLDPKKKGMGTSPLRKLHASEKEKDL